MRAARGYMVSVIGSNRGRCQSVAQAKHCAAPPDDHVSRYQSLLSSLSSLRVDTAEVTASIEQLVDEVDREVRVILDFADKDVAEAERLGHEELGECRRLASLT